MLILTYEHVVTAARDWYNQGKLIAQHGPVKAVSYRHGEYRCAIAASLPIELILELEARSSQGMLVPQLTEGLVKIKPARKIVSLQFAHDQWAMGLTDGSKFKALIGVA